MTASNLHLSPAAAPVADPETTPAEGVRAVIDWPALRVADHACCCAAQPAVVVIIPPVPGRSHPTDLLLCGHHYRTGHRALAAAGTSVFTVAGEPVPSAALWQVGAGPDR